VQQLVRDAVRLLEGEVMPAEKAAALARLVGSREELLAHLLVRRRALHAFPEILAGLSAAAAEVGAGPATDRPEQAGDAARDRADFLVLDAALRALFAGTAADEADNKAARALRRFRGELAQPPR
jgi:hypothetical protein